MEHESLVVNKRSELYVFILTAEIINLNKIYYMMRYQQ